MCPSEGNGVAVEIRAGVTDGTPASSSAGFSGPVD